MQHPAENPVSAHMHTRVDLVLNCSTAFYPDYDDNKY